MTFWQALLVAAVPSIAAVATAILGFRDLGMRRRLETSKQFLTLFAAAHGRPVDGRSGIGIGEQIATVFLIADFANGEQVLREAARRGLSELSNWDGLSEIEIDVREILDEKGRPFPASRTDEIVRQTVIAMNKHSVQTKQIAAAAREALTRLR